MTPEQKHCVQQTWQAVTPIADTAARLFYDRLFETNPEIRALFDSVDLDRQRNKLIQALDFVIDGLDRADTVVPALEDLGRRHAGYGVTDLHYYAVGDALLWTLQQGLGDAWTADVKSSWTAAYAMVAGVMRGAAAKAAGEPVAAAVS